MGDHRDRIRAEQVRATVGIWVEAVTHAAQRRTQQQTAKLGPDAGRLGTDAAEGLARRPLTGLQRDVAGLAVGDDDVDVRRKRGTWDVKCETSTIPFYLSSPVVT